MSRRLSPYQKIKRAWQRGTGVRLTADDVTRMGLDDAIMSLAEADDLEMAAQQTREGSE